MTKETKWSIDLVHSEIAFKIRHLLVFEGFKFTGVITMHDLMLASLKENTAIPQFQ